jgi:hypothetical protein
VENKKIEEGKNEICEDAERKKIEERLNNIKEKLKVEEETLKILEEKKINIIEKLRLEELKYKESGDFLLENDFENFDKLQA